MNISSVASLVPWLSRASAIMSAAYSALRPSLAYFTPTRCKASLPGALLAMTTAWSGLMIPLLKASSVVWLACLEIVQPCLPFSRSKSPSRRIAASGLSVFVKNFT